MPQPDTSPTAETTPTVRRVRRAAAWLTLAAAGFAVLLGWSSWQAFARDSQPPALAAVEATHRPGVAWPTPAPTPPEQEAPADTQSGTGILPVGASQSEAGVSLAEGTDVALPRSEPVRTPDAPTPPRAAEVHPSQTRAAELIVDGEPWTGPTFDGRPIRPVRTVTMRTTAYSPDEQSCGIWADGITASGMSVWTNGMKLAAADPSIPFGTILTVPGYNDGHPVPVLDRGGAIKGNRLDLLYPTHDIAMQWGVQELEVTVWEYAD